MSKPETILVASTRDLRAAISAGYPAEKIAIPDLESEITKARAAGFEEGRAAGYDAGRAALASSEIGALAPDALQQIQAKERARILHIQALAEEGLENIARAAIDQGDSVEKFAMAVLTEKKDRGITMEAVRRDAPLPAPHGGFSNHSLEATAASDPERLNRMAEDTFARRKAETHPPAWVLPRFHGLLG